MDMMAARKVPLCPRTREPSQCSEIRMHSTCLINSRLSNTHLLPPASKGNATSNGARKVLHPPPPFLRGHAQDGVARTMAASPDSVARTSAPSPSLSGPAPPMMPMISMLGCKNEQNVTRLLSPQTGATATAYPWRMCLLVLLGTTFSFALPLARIGDDHVSALTPRGDGGMTSSHGEVCCVFAHVWLSVYTSTLPTARSRHARKSSASLRHHASSAHRRVCAHI
jgi:hypothetical protein